MLYQALVMNIITDQFVCLVFVCLFVCLLLFVVFVVVVFVCIFFSVQIIEDLDNRNLDN